MFIIFWDVTLHSLSYLTYRDFYFERALDGSVQSPLTARRNREYRESVQKTETDHGVRLRTLSSEFSH